MSNEVEYVSVWRYKDNPKYTEAMVQRGCSTAEQAWETDESCTTLAVLRIEGDKVELVEKPEPKMWVTTIPGDALYPASVFNFEATNDTYTVYREDPEGNLIRLSDGERDAWIQEQRRG